MKNPFPLYVKLLWYAPSSSLWPMALSSWVGNLTPPGNAEGFTPTNSSLTVASGFASGTTTNGDSQLRSATSLNLSRGAS